MGQSQYQQAMQSQFVGQWITSLAISVICCAILFVVFASYMVQIHEKANLSALRIELLQEKYDRLVSRVDVIAKEHAQVPILHIENVVRHPDGGQFVPASPASDAMEKKEETKQEEAPSKDVMPAPEAASSPAQVEAAPLSDEEGAAAPLKLTPDSKGIDLSQ